MPKHRLRLGLVSAALFFAPPFQSAQQSQTPHSDSSNVATQILAARFHESRSSPSDLEIGGELAGVRLGEVRYMTRADLLALPQVTYTVTDDANFTGPTEVSGVLLEELLNRLSAMPEFEMAVAICSDKYHAHYPKAYLATHRPILVLKINGQAPEHWPKDSEGHGLAMGPYLISHAKFVPGFKILGQPDEPQIPWGVVRIDFHKEESVFATITPRGPDARDASVQDGFRIAKQHCLRCHNMGDEGGRKAGRPWQVLAAWASSSPDYFAVYVRNPQSKNPCAQMPGNPGYDDATIRALRDYFDIFSSEGSR
jgi:mono/diheme cytochrome c family protein